jgi:predicted CDP-diglyceride synthetase/phosphatidate cytidylyltransferase
MSEATRERLFGFRHAFDDRVTVVLALTALVLFLLAPLLIFIVTRAANSTVEKKKELWDRYRSWIWLAALILIPILAGAFWTIIAVATLSFLCYREYARITGLFRERTISLIVVIGILLITCSVLDNWYRLFVALFPLTVALIAIGGFFPDQPKGYIQRVGLGVLGFTLFGSVWFGTALDTPVCLLGLGIIVSVVGQFGDLMLSSIKRDLGLKDTSKLIPGHGGILDRFDSLILVAPAVFHYVNYFVGFGVGQLQQIFSGWQI